MFAWESSSSRVTRHVFLSLLARTSRMLATSIVGSPRWHLEAKTRLLSRLMTGGMSLGSTMLPHETLLRPVHPYAGRSPEMRVTKQTATTELGSASNWSHLSLRERSDLKGLVTTLSLSLRLCHRKRIEWLEPTLTPQTEWLEYAHNYLVAPILQLFQQLHAGGIEGVMFSQAEQDEHGTVEIKFSSPEFGASKFPVYPPTLFITPNLFHNPVDLESIIPTMSLILDTKTHRRSKTIVTDLKSVIVIHPAKRGTTSCEVEVIPLKDDLRSIRIITTAYLRESLYPGMYLNIPDEPAGKYQFWLPSRHYESVLLTDEEVFQTKHRNSDFDILKLMEDRDGALQFFRWKQNLQKSLSPHITASGEDVECTTNDFDQQYRPPRGICSKPIPPQTLHHMETILRPNPFSPELLSSLKGSKHFTITLGELLERTDLSEAVARVHLCHLKSIDGRPVENSPELVMKIFDDRFMRIINPYNEDGLLEEDVAVEHLPEWLQSVLTAEWHVRGELTAFEKMEMAQGSLIPYFFGAHKFRLPSGHEVYGILMEYVTNAPPMDSGVAGKWTKQQQTDLMTSIRHGLRVMQNCDIAQHDWHSGQILCRLYSAPASSEVAAHAVFIDFSATTQTTDLEIDYSKDDYGLCVSAIIDDVNGLDTKWELAQWDREDMKRENWDAFGVHIMKKDFTWSSKLPDPYAFVYESI